jgi:hypothetical protein
VRQRSEFASGVQLPSRAQLHGILQASSHSGHGENSVGSENLHVRRRCGVFVMKTRGASSMPADDPSMCEHILSYGTVESSHPAEYSTR